MNPKVFISYSWDNKEHEEWVMGLVVDLRKVGIDATIDKLLTQQGTVHLDKMMVDGFKDYDKVILVLTEEYAKKSDENQGGVGFETLLYLPILKKNPNKLIPISRHTSQLDNSMPLHLQGYYIIDFSSKTKYFEKLTELTHRIREINQIEIPAVGKLEKISPQKIKGNLEKSIDDLIPNLTEYKEQDKNEYLIQEMAIMWDTFIKLSDRTKQANSNFEYVVEVDQKCEKIVYYKINKVVKSGIHIRLNDMFGSYTQIVLSYGTRHTKGNSSSFNEMISCNINSNNELELSGLVMNFGGNKSTDPVEITKNIWLSQIVGQLKY